MQRYAVLCKAEPNVLANRQTAVPGCYKGATVLSFLRYAVLWALSATGRITCYSLGLGQVCGCVRSCLLVLPPVW